MNKDTTNVLPKAIYKGFNSHDCEAYYKCPICNSIFGSWSLPCNAKVADCPRCGSKLQFGN